MAIEHSWKITNKYEVHGYGVIVVADSKNDNVHIRSGNGSVSVPKHYLKNLIEILDLTGEELEEVMIKPKTNPVKESDYNVGDTVKLSNGVVVDGEEYGKTHGDIHLPKGKEFTVTGIDEDGKYNLLPTGYNIYNGFSSKVLTKSEQSKKKGDDIW